MAWYTSAIVLLILFAGVGIGVVGAILKKFGSEEAANFLEKIGLGIIVGFLIGFNMIILLSCFEILELSLWAIGSILLMLFIFLGFYQSGGPEAVYMISIFVLIFGYMFTGPYSGYIKTTISGIAEPLGIGIDNLKVVGHDLGLILLNPQGYIDEQKYKNVQAETPASSPRGVEIMAINLMPDAVASNRTFNVQVRCQNKATDVTTDFSIATDVKLAIGCANEFCCNRETDPKDGSNICGEDVEAQTYKKDELKPYEAFVFQPANRFLALGKKESDIGRTANLNITLTYDYKTSSSLLVEVMNENEIYDRLAKGDDLFRGVVATGKPAPAMISLNVGDQPLFNNAEQTLIVSVVNKRVDAKILLKPESNITITISEDIGNSLNCPSGKEMVCNNEGLKSTCNIKKDIEVEPLKYRAFICSFKSSQPEISKTNLITAEIDKYTVEISEEKGPMIERGGELATTTTTTVPGAIITSKCKECNDWHVCSKNECHELGNCIFYNTPLTPNNKCEPCSDSTECSNYPDEEECKTDDCDLGNCEWKNNKCEKKSQ